MNQVHFQDVDPRVLLSHFEEQISDRRRKLSLEGSECVHDVQLLDIDDRPAYLMCLVAIKSFQSLHGRLGIHTPADMVEHIQLVEHLSAKQADVSPGELRTFSLDLLRSMRTEQAEAA